MEGDVVEVMVLIGDVSSASLSGDEAERVAEEEAPAPVVYRDTQDTAPLVIQPHRAQEAEGCIACIFGITHEPPSVQR